MCLVTQSCPTLCNPTECSPLGSSVHGILQARTLELLPFPSPGDLPELGTEPRSPTLQVDSLLSKSPGRRLKYSSIIEYLLRARHSMIAISFHFYVNYVIHILCYMGYVNCCTKHTNLRENNKKRGLFLAYFPVLEQCET